MSNQITTDRNVKTCRKCGVEIVNGQNGCQLLGNICFDCNGGHPHYPPPVRIDYPESMEYLDWIEGKCLDMGWMPD